MSDYWLLDLWCLYGLRAGANTHSTPIMWQSLEKICVRGATGTRTRGSQLGQSLEKVAGEVPVDRVSAFVFSMYRLDTLRFRVTRGWVQMTALTLTICMSQGRLRAVAHSPHLKGHVGNPCRTSKVVAIKSPKCCEYWTPWL